jgi:hypothetical protein
LNAQPSRKITDQQLKILWGIGAVCAFRGCGQWLVQEASANDPAAVVGQMAHIVAHSDQGPRADPSYPPERRNLAENLILLCPTHHVLVDAQDSTYTVEELRGWKAAEERLVRGFRFDVEIERARSAGVSNMKVFAFDITLLQLWSEHPQAPGFVIHDSLLYDSVDERQKALALDLAAREAEERGWQYICTFNSDELPVGLIPDDSPARADPILTLTDATDDGMLLGRRFS